MSVDFSPYINLQIYDKDAGELYLSALELLRLNVPQLTVRPGTIEDGLTQAFAYITSVACNHMNVLPNRIVEGLARFMGVTRRAGTYASVSATVTALDYAGTTLDAGVTMEYKFQRNGQTFREYYELLIPAELDAVEEDPDADPPTPLPTKTINLVAVEQGIREPIPDGAQLTLIDSQPLVDFAVADDDFIQGSLEETDAEYLARMGTFLRSLSETVTTAKQLESNILANFNFVVRAKAFDLTNSEADRSVDADDAPGYISVFVYGKGRPLSIVEITSVYSDAFNKVVAGLQVVVQGFDILEVQIQTTVKISASADIYSAESAIKSALTSFISPSEFPLADNIGIRKSQLIAKISEIPGVSYVSSLAFQCDDTTASGDDLIFDNKGVLPYLSEDNLELTVEYV